MTSVFQMREKELAVSWHKWDEAIAIQSAKWPEHAVLIGSMPTYQNSNIDHPFPSHLPPKPYLPPLPLHLMCVTLTPSVDWKCISTVIIEASYSAFSGLAITVMSVWNVLQVEICWLYSTTLEESVTPTYPRQKFYCHLNIEYSFDESENAVTVLYYFFSMLSWCSHNNVLSLTFGVFFLSPSLSCGVATHQVSMQADQKCEVLLLCN